MIVFDFDKTLTDKDTLFGFYKIVHGDNFKFRLKRIILILVSILYKINFINNYILKKIGVRLFLNSKSIKEIESKSEIYAQSLELNDIYYNIFLNCPRHKRVIISASPEIYLKKKFPNENVIGTILDNQDKNIKLKMNCYNTNKVKMFLEKYPNSSIEAVYSDSYSDKPLFEIAAKYFLVKDAKIESVNVNKTI